MRRLSTARTIFASCATSYLHPIVAVNALFYAVGHWNAYFDALIYLSDESLYPLQLVLRRDPGAKPDELEE